MYRILQVYTPSYSYYKYKKLRHEYHNNIKEAHKRFLKLKTKLITDKTQQFKVDLVGFDGSVKYSFIKVNKDTFKTIFDKIDEMPMGYLRPKTLRASKSRKNAGLSLYADYNPKKTLKGTGFKDAATAKRTLKIIATRDLTYQKQVVNTMYNRAKYHPHQTTDMKEAMDIYSKWKKIHN